jgi:5-hydroxyisourate hydrolase-like protein (transthyretin family)
MNFNNRNIKPYKARNMMLKKLEVQPAPSAPEDVQQSQPSNNQGTELQPSPEEIGYINVGVYTASGALPVKDAVVTLYHTYNDSEEHVLFHQVTDESGRVPTMYVPVEYSGVGQQTEYDYSTYNLRVQAIGYYTSNVMDLQVFPNIGTNFRLNLIPTAQGAPESIPGNTIVIPPRPNTTPVQ